MTHSLNSVLNNDVNNVPNNQPSPTRYLLWFLLPLVTALVGIGLFSAINNPYNIFSAQSWTQKNTVKPYEQRKLREFLSYKVERAHQQNTIILGSSRALRSIPIDHPAWPAGKPIQMSMPLASLYEQHALIQYAAQQHDIKHVFLTLDLLAFDNAIQGFRDQNTIIRMSLQDRGWFSLKLEDHVKSLFSEQAIRNSWDTMQRYSQTEYYDDAQTLPNYWQSTGLPNTSAEDRFVRSEKAYINFSLASYRPCQQYSDTSAAWPILAKILTWAYTHNIDLRMAVMPIHARQLELLHATGHWSAFTHWKTRITQMNAAIAARHQKPIKPVWDFAYTHPIVTEPVPSTPNQPMQWFYDGAHINAKLGAYIVNTVWQEAPTTKPSEASQTISLEAMHAPDAEPWHQFGQPLTTTNIAEWLTKTQDMAANYRHQNPSIIAAQQARIAKHKYKPTSPSNRPTLQNGTICHW